MSHALAGSVIVARLATIIMVLNVGLGTATIIVVLVQPVIRLVLVMVIACDATVILITVYAVDG
jgi:hypothetical protein